MYSTVESEIRELFSALLGTLPELLGAVLLLIAGWLLGKLLRLALLRAMRSFNQFFSGRFHGRYWEFVHVPNAVQSLLGYIIFCATLLIFGTVAMRLIGFTGVAGWLEALVIYLPSLFAGGVIIIGGFVLGAVMRRLVIQAANAADLPQPALMGKIAQISFIIVALVIGLGQIGIDVTFLILLSGIVLGAILAGFALAFGLGAQKLVVNLIAQQHLRQLVRHGQTVRIDEIEGRVLEFTSTGVLLETGNGRTYIPAKICLDQHLTLLNDETSHDDL